jgi:hypothetical protein
MSVSKKKSQRERLTECVNIRGQLTEHGLDTIDTVTRTVIPKMNSYVRDGVHDSGRFFIPELGRQMEFLFTNNPRIASHVVLRAPPVVKRLNQSNLFA